MNMLLPMITVKTEFGLAGPALPATPDNAEFGAQLAMALQADTEAPAQPVPASDPEAMPQMVQPSVAEAVPHSLPQAMPPATPPTAQQIRPQAKPQTTDPVSNENPIDSSISVAHSASVKDESLAQVVQPPPDKAPDAPIELAKVENMPVPPAPSVEPSPDNLAALVLQALPLASQVRQTESPPSKASSSHTLSIGSVPLRAERPIEIQIAAPLLLPDQISEPAPFETAISAVSGGSAPATKVEAVPLELEINASDWTTRLAHEILSARDSSASELTFRLTPKHLGTLDIGLTETPQGLIIELRPSSEEAKAIIAREEPRLIDELRQRGVMLAENNLHFGANGDSRNSRNGAIPRPLLPFMVTDQKSVRDQDQDYGRPTGRFA